ncbi:MAG: DUF86 domain-containing protein [Rhizobiales bacterium]|nr:DUF86 domain-containing protein [Hyphomicrobiales bacterium]
MRKDWRDFAWHIVEGIERIWDYRARVKAGRADADMAFDATLRLLETVCEAASDKLPKLVKQRYPTIDWVAISGLRVRLAHGYLAIDPVVIETTITRDLDQLYQAMKSEISNWETRQNQER